MKIALFGFIGSGKGAASDYFKSQGYQSFAFADPVKDCLSVIFGWERSLLEGDTVESREFRDTVDTWWSKRLGIPNFTPRYAMTNYATDTMRHHFHPDIWVACTEKRLHEMGAFEQDRKIVISDVRFKNEIDFVTSNHFCKIAIERVMPDWIKDGEMAASGDVDAIHRMKHMHKVHESEWNWLDVNIDCVIKNQGTISELHEKLKDFS